jgi:hypothetical protein
MVAERFIDRPSAISPDRIRLAVAIVVILEHNGDPERLTAAGKEMMRLAPHPDGVLALRPSQARKTAWSWSAFGSQSKPATRGPRIPRTTPH